MPPTPGHTTILGAGLTGLSTAYHLSRASSSKITLIDAAPRIGGWIDSTPHQVDFVDSSGVRRKGEVVLESGPRTIRPKGSRGAVSMLKMLRDLDLLDEIIPISTSHPAAKNRYLLDTSISKLTALPSSLASLMQPQPPLLKGLMRSVLTEPFKRRRSNRNDEMRDESVDSFFTRRFGSKIATNLASAMVHGIYATSSTSLSVRAAFPSLWDSEEQHGSVVLGMMRGTQSPRAKQEEEEEWRELGALGIERKKWALYGLKGGLGRITQRLQERLADRGVEFRLGHKVKSLDQMKDGKINIKSIATENKTKKEIEIESNHVISALPPKILGSLLGPNLEPLLGYNPSTSVGVVNLVYPLPWQEIHPEGFGYLIPRPSSASNVNPNGVLGVIFDSTALPSSPVEVFGQVTKLTLMIGGPYWSTYKPLLPIPSSSETLTNLAIEHLHTVFPQLKNVQPLIKVAKLHKDCIPTYLPGHGDRLRELHHTLQKDWKGLSLVGNGYGGVGVNDCVYSAVNVAQAIADGRNVTGLERWAEWN